MTLIDSHAHLTFDVLHDDLDAVLTRATDAGVVHIVTIGTHVADSRQAVALASDRPQVSAVVGIHPHEAAKVVPHDVDAIRELVNETSVVGIGEIGLDYHYDFADRQTQRQFLQIGERPVRTRVYVGHADPCGLKYSGSLPSFHLMLQPNDGC